MNRRAFLKKGIQSAIFFSLLSRYENARAAELPELCIMHTNDVHSHLDPFSLQHEKYPGMGGLVAREKLINTIRSKNKYHLLLDAGDMIQGTPYFNMYQGEAEIKAMNLLQYDAGTIGNHDFDGGLELLAKMVAMANFPIVNCNYNFTNTILENKIPPYVIIKKGKLKIGILGLGIALDGLVLPNYYGNIKYHDPIASANNIAYILKHNKKCDYIICLSHLGYDYKNEKISDRILASASENIDLIIGGHTHTFLEQEIEVKNKKNKAVLINQVGWAGLVLGKINIKFSPKGINNLRESHIVKTMK